MKILHVYTHPAGAFTDNDERLLKIQVDNTLSLGYTPDDVVLVTNFPYLYRGVAAMTIPCLETATDPTSNKVPVIQYLLHHNSLSADLHWYHDLDVFQLDTFPPPDVEQVGLSRYAYKQDWQCGSLFIRPTHAHAFFDTWYAEMARIIHVSEYSRTRTDEKALKNLTFREEVQVTELNHRYNFVHMYADHHYRYVTLPVCAVHFALDGSGFDFFAHGKNKKGIVYLPERLTRIFAKHGIA